MSRTSVRIDAVSVAGPAGSAQPDSAELQRQLAVEVGRVATPPRQHATGSRSVPVLEVSAPDGSGRAVARAVAAAVAAALRGGGRG